MVVPALLGAQGSSVECAPVTAGMVVVSAPQIQVGPVPVMTGTAIAQTPEGGLVIVQFQTPQGTSVFFLSPDHARVLAKELADAAGTAATGLIIPDGPLPPPSNGARP